MLTTYVASAPRLGLSHAGSGPCVLFLHGIGGNRSHWTEQIEFFAAQGYHAAALNFRGYGDSEDYEGPLDFIADFSDDVLRALDHLEAPRAHLVGLSMGGRVARWFYLRHPQRVASLTLANTQPGFDTLGPEATENFVAARLGPLMAGHDPADLAHDLARGLIGSSAAPGAYDRVVATLAALHRISYMKTVRASAQQDRGFDLAAVAAPTLVIAGEQDQLYPPNVARGMADRIAGAQFEIIKGAGHLSNLEQPERFNQCVLNFLRRQPA
jgi:3-oxoadipate enol-lactonase